MNAPSLYDVAIAGVLVLLAMAAGRWYRLPVLKDMAFGSVRGFVQLVAVGYALHFIFGLESPWLIHLAIVIMIVVGAHASAGRMNQLEGAFIVALVSMAVGSFLTLGLMMLLGLIKFEARYIIPLAGMIIGNSMNASSISVERLTSDLRSNRLAIETALALGKSWREAAMDFQKSAARAGMISMLNFMKTVGIVALPGAMTGMILAGAEPLQAVYLQLIVAYMLLASNTITSIVAVELTVRKFFTRYHQLRQSV
ncbi:MAG TPA: iron export ABC transporter permease subunit FetB [candidate division Zixibacteria bacterium]|nr:iron export ABC transporter permease subunit FetB [candidate division Zixibacteria bacterium]